MNTNATATIIILMLASGLAYAQSANEILVSGITPNGPSDVIVIYSSEGGVWVNKENTTQLGTPHSAVGVGDVDYDGVNDIAAGGICPSTGCPSGIVKFLKRDASGAWAPFYTDTELNTPGSSIQAIHVSDIDSDGINEVVACGKNPGPTVIVYDYQPATGTYQRMTVNAGGYPNDCALSDMDGDGYTEIFFQNTISGTTPGPILVYEYDGAGLAQVHTIQLAEWDWPRKAGMTVVDDMSFGDVNNDGTPEVIFCGNDAYAVLINYTGGDYKTIFTTNYLLGSSSIDYIQACDISDLNGDGYNDIILANKQIMYFEKANKNDRGYAFKSTWNDTKQTYIYGMNVMCSGDADADGRNELFIRSNTADKAFWAFQNDNSLSPWGPPFYKTVVSTYQAGPKCTVGDIGAAPSIPQGVCGDGVRSAPEACDGTNLGGTCQSLGFIGGILACTAECTFDTSQCAANPCGDGYCDGATGENCNTCPSDCISGTIQVGTCGACFKGACDGSCNLVKETYACSDCSTPISYCCGDGACSGIESQVSCAYDCTV